MSNLKEKIKLRLDEIEDLMNGNQHLLDPVSLEEMVSNVSKFWSVLSEEDRDFIDGVRWAIEEKAKWKND